MPHPSNLIRFACVIPHPDFVDRTVEVVHNVFVRQNSGLAEPWQPFPWTVGQMLDPLVWNPEQGYGGAGDFANYAVATAGNDVLSTPLTSDLAALDEGWRQTLFDESGAILGGSKGWGGGSALSPPPGSACG